MTGIEVRISESAKNALATGSPVVALESTVIAHGLPEPLNLETAIACEAAIRDHGVTPATIGIVDGLPVIGLSDSEIVAFASGNAPDGKRIEKTGLNNLAGVVASRSWGATTVASSIVLALGAGIRVFSTGGIGGVHRGATESFDVSADLTALGRTPLICVCAGAKAILDLPKTVEFLETLGVPIIGYGTSEFPAFYSRSSGLPVDIRVDSADQAAEIADLHWRMGRDTALLVCVPLPVEFEIPADEVAAATREAVEKAERGGVHGKALTPFLLTEMKGLTGGRSLNANRALLLNNAEVAAAIALSLARRR